VEASATNLNSIIEEECCELPSLTGTRIFANLLHADPRFNFTTVLHRMEPAHAFKLSQGVKEHVEALLELYQWKKDGDSTEASSETMVKHLTRMSTTAVHQSRPLVFMASRMYSCNPM
jgi:hypothetical protein